MMMMMMMVNVYESSGAVSPGLSHIKGHQMVIVRGDGGILTICLSVVMKGECTERVICRRVDLSARP